jgi:sulfur-oxidizing protein SoxY
MNTNFQHNSPEFPLPDSPTRRRVLGTSVALGASLLGGAVWTRPAYATTEEMAAAVRKFANGSAVMPGRVRLAISPIVDNGNTVPVEISVASPMTAADHVTHIALFNERNPQADVVNFYLSHRAGRAHVATRIRLATTQKLVAVARMNDGSFWSHTVEVIVAIAACLEGDEV